MFADQQIGGNPDVAVGDHFDSSRPAEFLTLDDPDSAARKVLTVPRRYHIPADQGGGSASSLSVAVVLSGIAVRSLIGAAFAASTPPDVQRFSQAASGRAFGDQ
jgi:hypothetical protein